ncbi:phospholipase A2 inhibitor and Ly6/PLAUR domain-containing protein-like [Dendropsophus ebraccatus]|uniref:phospholipase A2 inhibitor and Ly6/PLAUR domain-containing protein-like n=1 Tax=Dendropsophus ebraccatus TaxID=150705 RepID=UPI0038322878
MNSFSTTGLLVFCALLGSAFPHQCISCVAENSTVCQESEMECIGSRCMTASQHYKNGDKEFMSIYKGCDNETLCGVSGSVTEDPDVKIRACAACCSGDFCNNENFQRPEEDSTPNGVKCPSAYCAGTTDECESDKEIDCTGSEKQCYDYRGKVMNPDGNVGDYSSKGCINAPGCEHNFACLIKVKEIERKLKC